MVGCIFCFPRKEDILYETKNFYVYLGIGLAAIGHVMIITKEHLPYLLKTKHLDEFLALKRKVMGYITDKIGEPFLAEYGPNVQTIAHAHAHIIPKRGEKYNLPTIIPIIKKEKVIETSWNEIKNIYEDTGIIIEDNGKLFYSPHKGPGAPHYLGYRFFLGDFDDTIPKSWKHDRDVKKDEERRNKTRELFMDF